MKKIASAPPSPPPPPLPPPRGWYVPLSRTRAPVQSITRAEIDGFWRRRMLEKVEQQLAAEKEAARIRAKSLNEEDYRIFEERVKEILDKGSRQDRGSKKEAHVTRNSRKPAVVARNSERRIGIKDWWTKSIYAYLNEPAITSGDESRKQHTITYIPQKICSSFCSSNPYLSSTTTFGIF